MASLNGVSLTGLKEFKDHEGATIFQGNVSIDGHKAGHWSQDYHGGVCDTFLFDTTELDKRVEDCKKGVTGVMYQDLWGTESFMMNLVFLTLREKAYRSWKKKGFNGMIYVFDGYYESSYPVKESDPKEAFKNNHDIVEEMKAGMHADRKIGIMVCTDPSHFNIRVDADHPETTLMI